MGTIILNSDANYNSYMDQTLSLVDLYIDAEDISYATIDSLVYLQAAEDELLEHIPDADDQSHADRNNILRFVMNSTARKIIVRHSQVTREQEVQEAVQTQPFDLDKVLETIDDELKRLADKLGIVIEDTTGISFDAFLTNRI